MKSQDAETKTLTERTTERPDSHTYCHTYLCGGCLAEQLETLGPIAAGTNMVAHVRATGKAESGGPGIIAACFAAGVLRHLPALMAWTLPSAASYARIQPACWSGAYRWGLQPEEIFEMKNP